MLQYILKLRNVGKPFLERNSCLEISVKYVLGGNFRCGFHIIRTFSADDGFKSEYAHNSAYSLNVNSVRKFIDFLSVNVNAHLSVSENSVAFSICNMNDYSMSIHSDAEGTIWVGDFDFFIPYLGRRG